MIQKTRIISKRRRIALERLKDLKTEGSKSATCISARMNLCDAQRLPHP